MIVVLLAVAGALGAVSRFVIDSFVKSKLKNTVFPWGTVGINISGSLLLGFLAGLVVLQDGSTDLQTVIGTGFCGGYTTFSTASVETVRLVQSGKHSLALINVVGTLVVSVGACAAGFALAGVI
ncbi:MAG: fluoride efflux transporter CrcB [Rhodococcus sp. (in: high G+C Gram-positive bacteria)]|jgi:fluoride exporter|uniref:fluoride efflux transporter CrcB n=1 Tax=Rhodococcus sp. EPR-157 TaxID=1813677 RepID=UPI0007BC7787|nr:fluoride efflux transporter CrcB [Rhodococcus sp. EPR-157]KZF01962.1 chromosome condensation protein CrcB [Rhodococcus sp. EPR-157]